MIVRRESRQGVSDARCLRWQRLGPSGGSAGEPVRVRRVDAMAPRAAMPVERSFPSVGVSVKGAAGRSPLGDGAEPPPPFLPRCPTCSQAAGGRSRAPRLFGARPLSAAASRSAGTKCILNSAFGLPVLRRDALGDHWSLTAWRPPARKRGKLPASGPGRRASSARLPRGCRRGLYRGDRSRDCFSPLDCPSRFARAPLARSPSSDRAARPLARRPRPATPRARAPAPAPPRR